MNIQDDQAGRVVTYSLLLLFLCVGLFFFLTIRSGEEWGDDFAMYVHHAENIAIGRPYGDTGYIYNPHEPDYGPITYPPLYPLLLSPVIRFFGLNFGAMKAEQVTFFLIALLLVWVYYRRELPLPFLLALLAIIGFSPVFWEFKDAISSDLLFLVFFFLTAILIERSPRDKASWYTWAMLTGFFLYACIGTRTIGAMLVPGFVTWELFRWRKITRFLVLSLIVCGVGILLQRELVTTGDNSYADQFHPTVQVVLTNISEYKTALVSLWPRSAGRPLSWLLFCVLSILACVELFKRSRDQRWTVMEPLLFFYLLLVLLWPANQGLRFLFPAIPLYLSYALLGLAAVTRRLAINKQRSAFAALLVLIGASYVGAYRHENFGTIPQTTGLASFNDLCRFINMNSSLTDVFVFNRARALSLFTNRPASVYFLSGELNESQVQWKWFQQIHARYVVVSRLFENDRRFLQPSLQPYRENLRPVYQNQDFTLYRIEQATAPYSGSLNQPR
jgi:hypothetical protein